jgi:hypothetical protein
MNKRKLEQLIRGVNIYGQGMYKVFYRKWYNPVRFFKGRFGIKVINIKKVYK